VTGNGIVTGFSGFKNVDLRIDLVDFFGFFYRVGNFEIGERRELLTGLGGPRSVVGFLGKQDPVLAALVSLLGDVVGRALRLTPVQQ